MADEAGSSGAHRPVDEATLAAADAKFERGIQCIRTNDIEGAITLFSEVLQVRAQHYGELAPECASAYYRYGAALLYQAQDSGDVFGANMKDAAGEEEDEDEEQEGEPAAGDNKENGGDKGKAPVAPTDVAGSDGDEGEGSGEAADHDLQLAWENLETAKVIWSRDGEDKNAQQLADVHGLLSDVAMEGDDFATALAELDAALAHLHKFVQEDDRRIAELQYKRCCALQFSGDVKGALTAVQAAIDCLNKRRQVLAYKLAAPGEGDAAEKLKAESEDVTALLQDLQEKVDELQEVIAQDAENKSMIKDFFAQFAGSVGGGGDKQAATGGDEKPAAAAGFASASDAASGAAVQNLGVVGRGTKRINLQPVQTNLPPADPAAGKGAAPSGQPPAKKKRSLEDLMGGGDAGETTIGFGSAPVAPPEKPSAEGSSAATDSGEEKTADAAAAAVPAFLQPANIKAVYGEAAAGQQQ